MRRRTFLLPVLLATAPSASAQVPYTPAPAPVAQAPNVAWAISDWRRLRQGSNYSFADYARFLIYNPGWPGETTLRRNAEKAMRPGENAATVLNFFATTMPVSGNGHARRADALAGSGRMAEALAAAREAWASGDLPGTDEQAIYARYGASFTTADHDRRADALLFEKKPQDAARFLAMTSPARQAAFAARIAMQTRAPDAEARYQPLLASVTADAGLMMDRARYLRESGYEQSAQQLFARPRTLIHRPVNDERFLDMMLSLASGASNNRDYTTAYNIARQLDDVFAPGADVSLKSLGIRDTYTSIAWLGGTLALDRLNRASDAVAMFDRYSRGGRSLQVTSKGLYWAGRAALAAGRPGDANLYFQRAATFPELFYGQLALERVGRDVPAPAAALAPPTPAQRAAFTANRLAQATRQMMYGGGSSSEQAMFVRALGESLSTDGDRQLAIELGQQIGRQDVAVWVARAARNKGSAFYTRAAFPTVQSRGYGPWGLTNGITRQESSFDRYAVSHAGARGLMQLMPGTAREQAGKMGQPYDHGRLTSDPTYNVMLGSSYFQRLLNMWDGNVPLAVASYNAGAGNVRKWVNAYGDPRGNVDVLKWIEAIPFMETRGYVQRVIENSVVYDAMTPSQQPQSALHVSRYLGKSRPA